MKGYLHCIFFPLFHSKRGQLLAFFLFQVFGYAASGQAVQGYESRSLWNGIAENAILAENNVRHIIPTKYEVYRLDFPAMRNALAAAPKENSAAANQPGLELHLPQADGSFARFKVWYSPVMAPALAAQYPEIRTYTGYNMDNPANTIKLDVTPKGFHAMTYGGGNSVFIDPYASGNTEDYICYFKHDFVKQNGEVFSCNVDDSGISLGFPNDPVLLQEFVGDCGKRHEYRIAISATGEYTAFHGGTVALAMAAINTTLNRVNGVFERDVASRMILIATNNLIVYTNAGTDPFTNGDPGLMIDENQVNTDAVIGNGNYDIGHVFGTNSGGLAGLGVVCNNAFKASGVTGSAAPVGDPFDIDYVAHEVGHQFNANHTQYNNCNRNNSTAIEPGSASTIMGYAGICAPDVQSNSDDYFSTASLFEMRPFVATGGGSTCDAEVVLANVSPTVSGLSNYSIPISTPFVLTASATDPNGTLTYCWEQIDAWSNPSQPMPPSSFNTTGPMFRSLDPVTSPSRYFYNLPDLFNNLNPTWEELPSIGRDMNFRVTVRDNFATAGCTGEASNTVTTVATAGPFIVTAPNTAVTFPGNSAQTVTWNVAGTTAAPISCANVDILLTTDGGASFTTLLANTPNDGTQSVTMPNINTTTARIWIQCSNNIFFDISNVNFSIAATAPPCTELFISEYIEGTSNNKAIEIYNPTGSAITLTGNYQLKFYFNGSLTAGTTIALVGTVASHDVFVVAINTANAAILAQADQTSTSSFYNGDDAVELFKNSTNTTIDVLGQIGFDPGTEWGTGLTSTADNTIRRKFSISAGDPVGSDVFDPAIEWDGFATDNSTDLGLHSSTCGCGLSSLEFSNQSTCNDNGTPGDPSDDYFTATIIVSFANPPGSGNLVLTGDVLTGGGALTIAAPFTSPAVFTGVRLKADGTASVVTATFSAEPACTFTNSNGPSVNSCAISCDLTTAGLSDVHCENNNETDDSGDDYIWFQLDPDGTGLGTGYNVTVSMGSVLLDGNMPANNVPYGASNFFRLQAGSAGAGNVNVTVTDATTGVPCTFTALIIDPGACSFVSQCDLEITNVDVTDETCQDADDGSITITATCTNCVGALEYSIDGVNFQPGNTFSNLAAGPYTVYVRDSGDPNNCIANTDVSVGPGDGTPPTFDQSPLPQDYSLECDEVVPDPETLTASDLVDPVVDVTFAQTTIEGEDCPQEFTIRRTWTATDDCGNSAQHTQFITITDDTPPVFNQDLPEDYTAYCGDALPMPEILDGTDNCDPGVSPPVVFINEIHYDNVGTDAGEFVEVAGTAGIDLSQYNIVLYNGATGVQYGTMILSGIIPDEGNGFGAIAFPYPVNGIQNGAPDGLAFATNGGMVVQFLSYEGSFVAVGGIADGMTSTDIGVLEDGSNAVGTSLQLTGAGMEYADFTWTGPVDDSPGLLNTGQTLDPLPGVIMSEFSQSMTFGDCNGESFVHRTWMLTDACGNSVSHTQTITLFDDQGPAFIPPLPQDITIECDEVVPPPADLLAQDACDMGNMMQNVWINEIHYDNSGTDAGEFIEIAGTAGVDLSAYSLVLYNGTGGAVYDTDVLSGIIPNLSNGFGTLCFGYPANGIQNGAPDGIALVHNVMGGMVVQFLSYEGTFTAVGGPANGMLSTDIGVLEDGTNVAGTSVSLSGNGNEYSDFVWNAPAAATNCGINTGQSFIPVSVGPEVTFSESEVPGDCPHERTITRTWSATDDCGNMNEHTQVIQVVDNTPPTLVCPPGVTVNLDIFGNATVTENDLNITVSDNCSDIDDIQITDLSFTFDCDDEGLMLPVDFEATDECDNTGACTVIVTVAPFSRCTPVILIDDPCVCKNNATTLTNGQFSETIKIESLAGKTWTVIARTGLYRTNSPAPPGAPVLIPIGTTFTENPANSGDYYLTGIHVDAIGYSITVQSETGQILQIGNRCEYPNPSFTVDLSGPFCLFSPAIDLTATPGDANIVSEGFTVNGQPATQFDPGQGVGTYIIEYTVDGGVPKAFGPNDPG
ncbi:MAG: lamin tail domain-containing protein, partial [Saprospiraceae bacterium]|nr:lamin tail domain-containing protein [Saprospiraceae bacterium]